MIDDMSGDTFIAVFNRLACHYLSGTLSLTADLHTHAISNRLLWQRFAAHSLVHRCLGS